MPADKGVAKVRGLYAVIDTSCVRPEDSPIVAERILEGGAGIIQLRAKGLGAGATLSTARDLRGVTRRHGALFIVNDRVDIAVLSMADGVHLGQEDIPIEGARKLLGERALIGVSTHNVDEAMDAEKRGADYISFGPIFPTRTKPDADTPKGIEAVRAISEKVSIPIVAIGGITAERAGEVLKAGADSVALISDILLSGDVTSRVRSIVSRIKSVG